MRITSGPASSENHSHMEFQIHCLETEAYGAVLRAFIAQSDVLSWGKEELITELRKELRVSDVEHREILGKINLDDTIKSIRGRRNGSEAQQLTAKNPPASDLMGGHSSCKRLKPAHMTPVVSSPRYPTAQPSAVPLSPLSMHVTNDQWNSKTTVFCPQMSAGQSPIPVPQKRQPPNSGKVRGTVLVKTTKKGFVQSGFGNMKPESGIIEMLATDKLIREVEKVCGEANPDRAQLERAKVVLKEHERALMDAIGKISSISEGDDSPDYKQMQYQYSSEERQRKTPGVHNGVYEQFDRSRSYYNDGYNINHSERAGIPCIDLGNDDYP